MFEAPRDRFLGPKKNPLEGHGFSGEAFWSQIGGKTLKFQVEKSCFSGVPAEERFFIEFSTSNFNVFLPIWLQKASQNLPGPSGGFFRRLPGAPRTSQNHLQRCTSQTNPLEGHGFSGEAFWSQMGQKTLKFEVENACFSRFPAEY